LVQPAIPVNTDVVLITTVDDACAVNLLDVTRCQTVPPLAISQEPLFSEEQLDAAIKAFTGTRTLPDAIIRPHLIDYARKTSEAAIVAEDYGTAETMDWVIEALLKACCGDRRTSAENAAVQNLQQRLETAEQAQRELTDYWDGAILQCRERAQRSREGIRERQEAELRAFEARWNRPEATILFAKPSSRLLQLRNMQKAHAMAHQFADAKKLKLQAEQLQIEESLLAQQRAAEAMRLEYHTLLEAQQRELQCDEQNWAMKVATLETEREKAVLANEKLRKQLTAKVANKRGRRRLQVLLPIVGAEASHGKTSTNGFSGYRRSPDQARLEFKVDPKSIVRPKTRATPRKGIHVFECHE
jgi:hypothetical protein